MIESDAGMSLDRGLLYGDGCFRTLRLHHGLPTLWAWHRQRLTSDCARLGIHLPDYWEEEVLDIAATPGHPVLRITVTRGLGGGGYRPLSGREHSVYINRRPLPASAGSDGVRLRISALRIARQPALAGIKHLNRLEQVMASTSTSVSAGAASDGSEVVTDELLMLDQTGNLVGGASSNLFLLRGNTLFTPRVHRCGVAGATRAWIKDAAPALGVDFRESDLKLSDLRSADEAFISNAVIGIKPVSFLESRRLSTGGKWGEFLGTLGAPFVSGSIQPNQG